MRDATYLVSIPFKRESGSKGTIKSLVVLSSGVSIPFKRESGSKVLNDHHESEDAVRFNSLQTGKRIQSLIDPNIDLPLTNRFNSLQTGKRIQSDIRSNQPAV